MNVTIIGAGRMAHGIGTRVLAGGHAVTIINRNPEHARKLADELNHARPGNGVADIGHLDALHDDIVVLAVGYGVNLELAHELAGTLAGKIVIDIANPVHFATMELATPAGTSSAEQVAAAAPGARVVKAFNTTFATTLVTGQVAGQPLDVFIASDDPAAKDRVAEIVRDGGLIPIDVGPLARARQLEGLGFLGISIQRPLGLEFQSAWKLLRGPQPG